MMPTPADREMSVSYRELTHKTASVAATEVLASLADVLALNFWTEHSMRSFLSTAAPCLHLGAGTCRDADLVGCWWQKGGQVYVRTVRHRVFAVQARLRQGWRRAVRR